MPGPDPDGQVSLMLCESILHILVEEGVISRGRRPGPRSDASYTGRSATRCIRCISRTGTSTPWISCRDAFRDGLSLSGGLLADECAALYVGPDEEVPRDEQFNR